MRKNSAGILVFRKKNDQVEVLLGHPGGPFYAKKDNGVWSIPKGEYEEDENALNAAKREFEEEIGQKAPNGDYLELGKAKTSTKIITAWAIEANMDVSIVRSNMFEMEWPPKSGQKQQFPEIDKADWFTLNQAMIKISKGQVPFIEAIAEKLKVNKPEPEEPSQQQLL